MADQVDDDRDRSVRDPIPLSSEETFFCSRCSRSVRLGDAGQKWGKYGIDVSCPVCGDDIGFKSLGYNPFE